jgi:protein-disulfide isomerase-like protein with CxxC motif
MSSIRVTHISDPGCPWAWSVSPSLAVLRWRYGDQLTWRHVMIGLRESYSEEERSRYTGAGQARSYRGFRKRGMPLSADPRPRRHGTWPMCRVVVAARRLHPEREWAVFRALQFAQFTTTLPLDDETALREVVEGVPGVDGAAVLAAAGDPETERLFEADRDEASTAAGKPIEMQGRAATRPDGRVRYTAPSLIFESEDGRRLEAGGFQPLEAYDIVIANLDPALERRPPAEDPADVLAAFPDGLTTYEVAAVMTPNNETPDRDATEDALIALAAGGSARRRQVGNDALWLPAEAAELAAAA